MENSGPVLQGDLHGIIACVKFYEKDIYSRDRQKERGGFC